MKRSKGYRKAAELIEPDKIYSPARGGDLAKQASPDQVRRHRRGRDAARRRPAQGRPDGPRHGQPAARHRQDRPRHRVRHRRQGRRGPRGRRRQGRQRRPDRRDHRRLPRLRRRDRHAGPDGQGRPHRPRARPAWPDAEPEDRHGHPGRRQGRRRHQGRQDQLPGRQAVQPAHGHRQGVVQRASSWSRTTRAALDEVLRAKPSAAKGRYLKKVTFSTTMGPGIPVDPNRTRNLLEDATA